MNPPSTLTPYDEELLARAVDLASANVASGGGPFGAVVRTADGRLVDGTNRVTATLDPTAHAEVMAIRAACQELGTFELTGAVLYASCEPCPMCLASALWARVDRVVFAADRADAARAGFDDAAFYEFFESPGHRALLPTEQSRPAQALEPFEAWQALEDRTEY
ncbi:nucleoside deaminase [Brachybacterium sp. GCM10030267]|uniref:nucleoside deaminase n=1 Tax=unclassified Brachybacterium TaxID=2623841 RepID=UPI003617B59F